MKTLFALILSFLTIMNVYSDPKKYLENRITQHSKRYDSFKICLELMAQRNAKNLVETGTARNGLSNCRGDGCSTVIFADWAKDHHAALTSIDINPDAIKTSMQAVAPINPNVQYVTQDSVSFLSHYNQKIDFLYLDSYDFDANNPLPSQMHHLNEIIAALPFLTKDSVVMIDDCDLPHGGKGRLVIDFLTHNGWKIYHSGYQTILIHKDS